MVRLGLQILAIVTVRAESRRNVRPQRQRIHGNSSKELIVAKGFAGGTGGCAGDGEGGGLGGGGVDGGGRRRRRRRRAHARSPRCGLVEDRRIPSASAADHGRPNDFASASLAASDWRSSLPAMSSVQGVGCLAASSRLPVGCMSVSLGSKPGCPLVAPARSPRRSSRRAFVFGRAVLSRLLPPRP